MSLSRQDILDYATRYVSHEEIIDFPVDGDLFVFLARPAQNLPSPDNKEPQWEFGGYGVCLGYEMDAESKPEGKWLFMKFATLATFPPAVQSIKLQPPHVATGRFSSADRSRELRIVRIDLSPTLTEAEGTPNAPVKPSKKAPSRKSGSPQEGKILQFRPKSD